jgi:hypothetical protein
MEKNGAYHNGLTKDINSSDDKIIAWSLLTTIVLFVVRSSI